MSEIASRLAELLAVVEEDEFEPRFDLLHRLFAAALLLQQRQEVRQRMCAAGERGPCAGWLQRACRQCSRPRDELANPLLPRPPGR